MTNHNSSKCSIVMLMPILTILILSFGTNSNSFLVEAFLPQNPLRYCNSITKNGIQPRLNANSKDVELDNENQRDEGKTIIGLDRSHAGFENSSTRRQLLRAMLAASVGGTFLPPISPVNAAVATQGVDIGSTGAPIPDWSGIKVVIPPSDDREYEVVVLGNGLRAVLCSDPSSNEAGAAMDVHVGACSDPKDIPGLAHFNERKYIYSYDFVPSL